MREAMLTPRPLPSRLVPISAGALVLALALPIFVLVGWDLRAWGVAAILWIGNQAVGALLRRFRTGAGNLAASGVVAFGMMFRAIIVGIVLFAVAVGDGPLALAAAAVYVLAYSIELALSLLSYFGATP
jgi:hypothetical protein